MDRIRISGKGPIGKGYRVMLNGVELTSCKSVHFHIWDANEVNTVELELAVDEIDIDAETLSELVAITRKRKKDDDHQEGHQKSSPPEEGSREGA